MQLDAAEDGELDDATRTALERFALGDKDSAKAALPKLLRIKVCQAYALHRQRYLIARARRQGAASGPVDPPDPDGVAPLLNPRPAALTTPFAPRHLTTSLPLTFPPTPPLPPCHPTQTLPLATPSHLPPNPLPTVSQFGTSFVRVRHAAGIDDPLLYVRCEPQPAAVVDRHPLSIYLAFYLSIYLSPPLRESSTPIR